MKSSTLWIMVAFGMVFLLLLAMVGGVLWHRYVLFLAPVTLVAAGTLMMLWGKRWARDFGEKRWKDFLFFAVLPLLFIAIGLVLLVGFGARLW